MLLQQLHEKNLINPPKWLLSNCFYLTKMGSIAYGVSTDQSDIDVYGFAIPLLRDLFPTLKGEIPGFGRQQQYFSQWQELHVKDGVTEYDFSVYNIVKYFQLCMENNPNMIDSLFVPRDCIIHSTSVSEKIRDNRRLFLHKGCYHKFRGYAFSQISKIESKNPSGKRAEIVKQYGFDTKHATHAVRLLLECRQILTSGDLILQQNAETLLAIRNGQWKLEQIKEWCTDEEANLESLYKTSDLSYSPDEVTIKLLLIECLEIVYGSIKKYLNYE